ncbi:ABC transporter ATP-binding protein [Spongiactinospora gelatinilytica]|uniref:ABC transporter ATP-binding protein n=1 Tax=Spongiactinospora gelatinilytica TaxID=2666298 RepID=A0A2W2GUJ3_9ACTN|nr:ABC transporter ATP-binding protein [Spongiactinospora gelatinilytica]PZG46209.1 ABC transporter ATP-binding protein [Spongiactinospora gelatinilytica]
MHADEAAADRSPKAAGHTPQAPTDGNRGAHATAAFAGLATEPGVAKPDPILVVDNVVRRFGGLTAVDVEHVEIQRGSITALIGPNGAGKTTFFNQLTGFDSADAGQWTFNGRRINGLAAHKIARIGMVRTFQLTKALSKLTVLENMRLGAQKQIGESFLRALIPSLWRDQEDEITQRAEELLTRFKLDAKRGDFAGSLSGGQRKLLEMARALMVGPELVMLDEPMAGVNPALTQSLLGHVKDLREQGMTVLFVEHDMDMVRDISDWVVVMAQGQVIAEGPPGTIMSDTRVVDAYLGAHHDTPLSAEEEERQLAEAEAELEAKAAQEPGPDSPETDATAQEGAGR